MLSAPRRPVNSEGSLCASGRISTPTFTMLQASRSSSSCVISSPSATASPHMSWKQEKSSPLKCAPSGTVSTSAVSRPTMYVFDCFDCVAYASPRASPPTP